MKTIEVKNKSFKTYLKSWNYFMEMIESGKADSVVLWKEDGGYFVEVNRPWETIHDSANGETVCEYWEK